MKAYFETVQKGFLVLDDWLVNWLFQVIISSE